MRILKNNATSTELLAKFGYKNEDVTLIKSKGFLLAGFNNYTSTSTPADTIRSVALPNSASAIYLIDSNNIEIDQIIYSNILQNVEVSEGQSLERKAFSDNQCVSAQNDGEFLGNGCDTDNADDFEIRNSPNPQNSSNLPEPRTSPTTPGNFTVKYNSSTMELVFNWNESQDYNNATSTINYKITDISNASTTLSTIETASTTAKVSINEIGRQYNFSIQALDKEGFSSATITASATASSFLSGLYFYQDPRDKTKNLIETYYNQYPFVPNLFDYGPQWKILVFYLNVDAEKGGVFYERTSPILEPANLNNVLPIKFKRCSGGSIMQSNSLILPDAANRCGIAGGTMNSAFDFGELEDNRFLILSADSINNEKTFGSNDYLTIAYYSPYDWSVGRGWGFKLVAVDKTKYYFGKKPTRQPPTAPTNFQVAFQQQSDSSYFSLSWATSTDPDSLDRDISYQLDYWLENNPADKKRWIGKQNSTQITVLSSGNYIFELRAFDDFNLFSKTVSVSMMVHLPAILIDTTGFSGWNAISIGGGNSLGNNPIQKIAQKLNFSQKVNIVSIVVGLANCWEGNCNPSGAKISLRRANGDLPALEEIYRVSLSPAEIPRYGGGVKTFLFFMPLPIELTAGDYFLVIEPENSPPQGFWNLVSLYSNDNYYLNGTLYSYNQQIGRWADYGRDTYFQIKGFLMESQN